LTWEIGNARWKVRMIAVAAVCFCDGAFAPAAEQPRHDPGVRSGSASSSQIHGCAQVTPACETTLLPDAGGHRDPMSTGAHIKQSPFIARATEPMSTFPGKPPFLTREVLDDMKATSVRDALRSTAGVRSEE